MSSVTNRSTECVSSLMSKIDELKGADQELITHNTSFCPTDHQILENVIHIETNIR